ncbi:helix-turn-helix domain-containing protein [Microbacterium sp. NPDC090007]|uniref:helix-turn-helix domain-containing protein n=1 Tax=Microbacterium sp. NPDC090007 TaxID=3364204 RepID=UPI0038118989
MLRLEGDEALRWFADRALDAHALTPATPVVFVDQITLAEMTVRRVWHTPMSIRSTAVDAPTPQSALVLQAEGQTEWSWSSGEIGILCEEGGAVMFPADALGGAVCRAPSGRIEVESAHLPVEGASALPGTDDGPVWKALASTVNAIFNSETRVTPAASDPLRDAIEKLCIALIASRRRGGDETGGSGATYAAAMTIIHEQSVRPDFSVEELAALLGISRQYLTRVFARHGRTPRDAVRARRWEVAEGLLAAGYHTADAVARSGFPSARALAHARRELRRRVEGVE